MRAVEYRIRWRRPHWTTTTCSKTRVLQRPGDVARFVAKLRSGAPVEVEVESREVGPWRPVEPANAEGVAEGPT